MNIWANFKNEKYLLINRIMQTGSLSSPYILTADIGGSHITTAIYNANTRTILRESMIRTGLVSKGPATGILTSWSDVFLQILKDTGFSVAGLTVAMPGPFDYEKGISYIKGLNKYEALYGMNIKEFLAGLLKIPPQQVLFRNDAESAIAGEVLMGAGRGYSSVMGITLGTGFGSAFSLDKITKDINLGSEPYKETIADDYLSTRWFLKRYHELTGLVLTDDVRELSALAAESAVARGIFKEFAANMSEFLSAPLRHYQPEALIICGNIAKAAEYFVPHFTGELNSLTIKLAQLGEDAPLIGAAAQFNDVPGWTHFDIATKL